MEKSLSFKEFMGKVEQKLEKYSSDNLREMIMEWARSTHPSGRKEFLEKLVLPSRQQTITVDKEILGEAEELAEKIENGYYCDGWGWDDEIHEERDWGDESWANEVDDFFSEAHDILRAGDYELARKVYAKLFDILDMGEESGHLPGADPESMLDTDIGEAKACYLRAVYMSSSTDKRPADLLEVMQRFQYEIGERLNLASVINVELEPLPDFEQFLSLWIGLLKKEKSREARYLLREAVKLSGGTKAIEKLASEEGKKYPKAYVDWISALEKEKSFQAMVKAAKQGLGNIPGDYEVRAEIAEGLVKAGKHLDNLELQLIGWRKAFHSSLSLSRFLPLIEVAEVIANRISKEKGAKLIEQYRKKYRHFSAFRRELGEADRKSGVLPES